jgi:hypothetical protein
MHGRLAIWMTILTLIAALAVPARAAASLAAPGRVAASDQMHFQATIAETQTLAMCSAVPSLCITIAGTGQATGMGPIKEAAFVISNLASNEEGPGCNDELRQTTFTTANHDTLTFDATGVSCGTSTTATAVDTYQVVGGTGRFSGARGSGIDTARIIVRKSATITFSGFLYLPGSSQ